MVIILVLFYKNPICVIAFLYCRVYEVLLYYIIAYYSCNNYSDRSWGTDEKRFIFTMT